MINKEKYFKIQEQLSPYAAGLVAVSKIKPPAVIQALYDLGHRDFGENYVQELVDKQARLPTDIRWHFIGHLQSNKVKYIAPFVHLIHSIDSEKLVKEVNKQAQKNHRVINILLQVHIAREETKFGMDLHEVEQLLMSSELESLKNVCIKGFMGMASFSDDENQVRQEFKSLKDLFDRYKDVRTQNVQPEILSMGMSGDYEWAVDEGSTLVRIGSLLFGNR